VVEGVTFYVKYLGSSVVVRPSGEEATAEAIRAIVSMVSRLTQQFVSESNSKYIARPLLAVFRRRS
jgi:hypothetical protein